MRGFGCALFYFSLLKEDITITLKKILTLMLALCMSATCLTACGDSDESDKKTNISLESQTSSENTTDSAVDSFSSETDNTENSAIDASSEADDSTTERIVLPVEERLALMEKAVRVEAEKTNGEWQYDVYDCYVELTYYIGKPPKELVVPDEIDGLPVWVVSAEMRAGENEVTTSVILPDDVLMLGKYAFSSYISLESIKIPDGVIEIPARAFSECSSLINVELPDSIISCRDAAFFGCSSLESITLPASVESISTGAFKHTNDGEGIELTVLNPECDLSRGSSSDFKKIYGYAGSTAEEFANENNIPFEAID